MTASRTLEDFIQVVSTQLAEPDPGVIAQIRGVVSALGPERVAVLVRTVVRLEQLGGCLIANGSRRRTPGGLFLVLARACVTRAQRAAIWPKTTNPPCDKQEGSVQSDYGIVGTGQALKSVQNSMDIIAPGMSPVNTEERRSNVSIPAQ
jgi:hypothetical protein